MTDAVPTPGLEELRLYDTRTRQVQTFVPLHPPAVGIYTCGPTVYAPQHLGNMRSQLFPDVLRRVLTAAGYDVTYITNITDVGHLVADRDDTDDKMELAAARTGQTRGRDRGSSTPSSGSPIAGASAASSRTSSPVRPATSRSRSR